MPEEIKQIRKSLGVTQGRLAEIMGVHKVSVSRWENGKADPSPMAVKFLRILQRVPMLIEPVEEHPLVR